ncbi:FAD-dependent oxidoreductase [Sphingomonas sp.]|uniref:FAD-dependent oxidoreductase n=1 Tax=Sphingomonas sp. TaxID=28214 RepID=UPI0025DE620C|nr:FAD-dependent oxidoreductase [Sphingomonas sp.]
MRHGEIGQDRRQGGLEFERGHSTGKVVKKLTSPRIIKGHKVAASKDNPEYLVKSSAGKQAAHKPSSLLIVGGGPAGMLAGLLFARAGVSVTLLEKHADFFRDFRGDTVHPSTMEILDQLGMLGRFLERPHVRLERAQIRLAGRDWKIGDLTHLRTPAPFIAMMPQWDFLDFLRDEASAFPGFALEMNAAVTGFTQTDGRTSGVTLADGRAIVADLVIAADGRSSLARRLLPLEVLGAPMDVFWFRIGKANKAGGALRGSIAAGRMVVLIDRGSYWQVAFLVPKGGADAVKAKGIEWVAGEVATAFPDLTFPPNALDSLDDLHLLTVALDRLTCWHRPGLLAIGDAAHAMSPIGGIGINLAIQDAVAAANALAGPMARGEPIDGLLDKVQARRLFPTRLIQSAQKLAQDAIIGRVLGGGAITRAPLVIRLLDRFPLLRRIPGRLIGLGIRREHVTSGTA